MARRCIAIGADVYRVRETGIRLSFDDYAAAAKTSEAIAKQRTKESKVNYHNGFLFASLMLAQHGGKYRKTAERPSGGTTVYKKTVYLPVIQSDPLPLADRKRLLGKKMAAKKRIKKNG